MKAIFNSIGAFVIFIYLGITPTIAQNWQWGKVGDNLPRNSFPSEIATDPNGNLYLCSTDTNIDVQGHFRKGYANNNICIVSYDCQGNYRWSKMIENGTSLQINTDQNGGVYVTGDVEARSKSLKVDEDTIIGITTKQNILIKFDTAGNFKWYRMQDEDSFRVRSKYTYLNLLVSSVGEVRIMTLLEPDTFCDGSYIVTDTPFSLHVLAYDANGLFEKGFQLDVKAAPYPLAAHEIQWDPVYDKYYLIGPAEVDVWYGGVLNAHPNYVLSKFDNKGKLEWLKTGNTTKTFVFNGVLFYDILIDADGSFYLSCSPNNGDSFDGYIFSNDSNKNTLHALLKYDKDGHRIWVTSTREGGEDRKFGIGISNNTLAAFGGRFYTRWADGYEIGRSFKPSLKIHDDTLRLGSYFARFDAKTGSIINVDSVLGIGLQPSSIRGNSKGGFYINGTTSSDKSFRWLAFANKDTFKTQALNYAFLIKYGDNDCGKLDVPQMENDEQQLSIYPNPCQDFVVLKHRADQHQLRIYNTMGQVVLEHKLSPTKEEKIQLQELVTGIYIVEIEDSKHQLQRTKLMKW